MKLAAVAITKSNKASNAANLRHNSMPRIRLHWDFFGPDAPSTAAHFLKHVDEFCARNGISGQRHWTTPRAIGVVATVECNEPDFRTLRDALRPKRGEQVLDPQPPGG
jgi:hypothetical protein